MDVLEALGTKGQRSCWIAVDSNRFSWENDPPRKGGPAVRRSPLSRQRKNLPTTLDQRLVLYALAAGAAGVSLLALAQPAEGEIVYTPANQIINRLTLYKLDLNHDGITDFTIFDRVTGPTQFLSSRQSLGVRAAPYNRVKCVYPSFCASTFIYAAVLPRGSQIGPSQNRHGWLGVLAQMALAEGFDGKDSLFGYWSDTRDGYLGLRFQINGEPHFGWARLSVQFVGGSAGNRTWEAHLTGYAYDTVANQPIKAGEISGTNDDNAAFLPDAGSLDEDAANTSATKPVSAVAQPSTLGKLALGAESLALRRREETESEVK